LFLLPIQSRISPGVVFYRLKSGNNGVKPECQQKNGYGL